MGTRDCEPCEFGMCQRFNGCNEPCAVFEHGNQGFFHHCLVAACPDGYVCETWPPENPEITFYSQPASSPCRQYAQSSWPISGLLWSDEFESGSEPRPPSETTWSREVGGHGWGN